MEGKGYSILKYFDDAMSDEEGVEDIIEEDRGIREIIKLIQDAEEEPYLYTGS